MILKRLGRSLLGTSAIFVGLAILGASFLPLWQETSPEVWRVDGYPFTVEVVRTPTDRAHGLMGRDSLAAGHGMLFVYPNVEERKFWMKNTRMPLDILFFNADQRLTQVVHAVPCTAEPCTVYVSDKPAAWVLELPAGTAEHLGFVPGVELSSDHAGNET